MTEEWREIRLTVPKDVKGKVTVFRKARQDKKEIRNGFDN